MNDLSSAAEYLRSSADVFSKLNSEEAFRRYQSALLNLAYVHEKRGDLNIAEEVLQEATRIGYPAGEVFMQLGELQLDRGRFKQGINNLNKAVSLFDEVKNYTRRDAAYLGWVGGLYLAGKYRKATDALGKFTQDEIEKFDQNSLLRISELKFLMHWKTAAFDEAELSYREYFDLALKTNDPYYLSAAYDNGAELALAQNTPPLALTRVRQALATITPAYNPAENPLPTAEQLSLSPYKVDAVIYLRDYARAAAAAHQIPQALQALNLADRLVTVITTEATGTESRYQWRQRILPIYGTAVELAREAGEPETAFHFLQRSRAALLAQELAENRRRTELPTTERETLDSLRRDYLAAQRGLLAAEDAATPDSLFRAARRAREDYYGYRAEVSARHGGTIRDEDAPELDLAAARELLVANDVDRCLQYLIGEERSYLLSFSAEDYNVLDLGPTAGLLPTIDSLLAYYAEPGNIDADPAGYLALSTLAYSKLLAPALSAQKETPEKLLLIPDGPLNYLPFAALVTGPATDLATAPYLLRRHRLSYAESLPVLRTQTRARTGRRPRALAYGPFAPPSPAAGAPPLPASAAEAAALRGHYRTDALLGPAATRAALLDTAGHFNLLHLSTHAYAETTGSAPPRILTATDPLYLPDIYALDLSGCDLVTLSACRTNVGRDARGEGLLSLSRAFTAAGARGVVASQWSVNDAATADLMSAFTAALAADQDPATALRTAQLALLDDPNRPAYLRGPYLWAGLTYYGNVAALPAAGWAWWMYGVIALGVGLLALGVVSFARRS